MRRRQLLRSGAVTLPLFAGCLSTPDDGTGNQNGSSANNSTGLPQEAALDTHAWSGSPTLTTHDSSYPQGKAGPYYLALLQGETDVTAFRNAAGSLPDAADTFLTRTDFEGESVIVIHDQRGSSHPNLAVKSVVRDHVNDTEGVHITAHYPGDARTADIIENTLLVRIAGHPEFARTTIGTDTNAPTIATANTFTAPTLERSRSLVVQNRDCQSHRLHVHGMIDGNLVAWESVEVEAGQTTVIENVFRYEATYDLKVRSSTTEESTTSTVSFTTAGTRDGIITIDASGTLNVSAVAEPPQTGQTECESGDLPYESSDPAENVDDPVDLWVVKQRATPVTLTVTIGESGQQVFERTFELGKGKAKKRVTDLLAKKAVYSVQAESKAGDRATTEFEVDGSVTKLTVHVGDDGEMSVVAN